MAAYPAAGGIVEFRHLVQAELLVVVGSDPFGGVDRPFFERREDLAARDLLGNHAELGQHAAGETADAEFQAVEIGDLLDLLAEPAAHLAAGVSARQTV